MARRGSHPTSKDRKQRQKAKKRDALRGVYHRRLREELVAEIREKIREGALVPTKPNVCPTPPNV